jgi:hypothetical protein
MASNFTGGVFQAQDATGVLPGALLYSYAAGTTTPLATYTDQGGLSANANPVVCDANGQAHVHTGTAAYKWVLKTVTGVTVWTEDNWSSPLTANAVAQLAGASVFSYIPTEYHAAILARTSTVDVSSYINECIEENAVSYMPAGTYLTRYPINLTARRSASAYLGRRLIGAGVSNTIINAYTGNYPAIDATGNSGGEVSGMNVRSDSAAVTGSATHCASVGLFIGRGAVSTSCNEFKVNNFRFNGHSDMTRNGSIGTIGIANEGAEHTIKDACELYANVPMAEGSTVPATISRSSAIATIGDDFEEAQLTPGSCTVHENRNMVLVALDSFRAYWGHEVAGISFPNLYTSTRYVSDLTPSYTETFYFSGAAVNVEIDCYQETSGLFTSTYKQDHRYLTFAGGGSFYENLDVKIQRGALDHGFTVPVSASSSIHLADGATLTNSDINCNYAISTYTASSDTNGFAAMPVSWAGTPVLLNVNFTLDHSTTGRTANIFVTGLGAFCTNVTSTNWRNGKTTRSDGTTLFTPVVIGTSAAGEATPSLTAFGQYQRVGQWCNFTLTVGWSNHTGTGNIRITGLPYTGDSNSDQAVTIYTNGLTVGAGYQLQALIPSGQTFITPMRYLDSSGAADAIAMDTAVAQLTITGCYRIKDTE